MLFSKLGKKKKKIQCENGKRTQLRKKYINNKTDESFETNENILTKTYGIKGFEKSEQFHKQNIVVQSKRE